LLHIILRGVFVYSSAVQFQLKFTVFRSRKQ